MNGNTDPAPYTHASQLPPVLPRVFLELSKLMPADVSTEREVRLGKIIEDFKSTIDEQADAIAEFRAEIAGLRDSVGFRGTAKDGGAL